MEFQDRNAGEEEFSQAIIENLFLLKDGSVVMGCHVVCGTVHRGDRFYYVDCVGRECFAVTVADIAVPEGRQCGKGQRRGRKCETGGNQGRRARDRQGTSGAYAAERAGRDYL